MLWLSGCGKPPAPNFRFNSVELLKQEKLTLAQGEKYSPRYRQEIELVLHAFYGTPDSPRLPELVETTSREPVSGFDSAGGQKTFQQNSSTGRLFQRSNLEHAAGPVSSDQEGKSFGLYREHCANCHGITGDGAGATAGFLDPYPRDFRLGKFKFKSTPLRQPPTHEDLKAILIQGIPGTAMPSFRRLKEEELEALIDYVRYLSIRGQTERYLIASLAQQGEEPLLSVPFDAPAESLSERDLAAIAEEGKQHLGAEALTSFFDRWEEADSHVTPVGLPPDEFTPDHPQHRLLIEQGRELYFKKANCAECHGESATGNPATVYFDDWTSDWVKSSGVDLTDRSSYRDFLTAGALPPRTVRPRNLRMAVLRGGSADEDIYRKIANGIEGTPMPSSAATLTEQEIWALVAYVQSVAEMKPSP
jgi:mono/diheme cytochrome c family protein